MQAFSRARCACTNVCAPLILCACRHACALLHICKCVVPAKINACTDVSLSKRARRDASVCMCVLHSQLCSSWCPAPFALQAPPPTPPGFAFTKGLPSASRRGAQREPDRGWSGSPGSAPRPVPFPCWGYPSSPPTPYPPCSPAPYASPPPPPPRSGAPPGEEGESAAGPRCSSTQLPSKPGRDVRLHGNVCPGSATAVRGGGTRGRLAAQSHRQLLFRRTRVFCLAATSQSAIGGDTEH